VQSAASLGVVNARSKPEAKVRLHNPPKPLAAEATTHDWASFLGPTHDAVSSETHLLKEWPAEGPELVWELPSGTGYAAPAISGERLVFFHRVDDQATIDCLHPETGQHYWSVTYPTKYRDRYNYNDGPRASPVIDGDCVYTYSAEGRLHCFDLQTGKERWKKHLSEKYKVSQGFFGVGATPLIEGELLIVAVGAPGGPEVIALNKQTGDLVWQVGDEWGPSYASPLPTTLHGQRRILVMGGGESRPATGGLISIDPEDGKIDFRFPWRPTSIESVNASCPVVVDNQIFISASYNKGGVLLEVQPDFSLRQVWTGKALSTHFNTAIAKDGYLYGFSGRNEPDAWLVCVEMESGKEMWREQKMWNETFTYQGQERSRRSGILRGNLLRVDGQFLCLGERGDLLWLDLTPDGYRELARTKMFFARQTWCLPVISRGLIYICQNENDPINETKPRLLCYDFRAGQ